MPCFEFSQSVNRNGVNSLIINITVAAISTLIGLFSPLLFLTGPVFYFIRGVRDLKEVHHWDYSKWNVMEFLWPFTLGMVSLVSSLIVRI